MLNKDVIVGHVPYNLAPVVEMFLRREANTGFAEVTGSRVNRGAGYEIPYIYWFYEPRICKKLEELLKYKAPETASSQGLNKHL